MSRKSISVRLVVREVERGAGVTKVCGLWEGKGWLVQDVTSRVVFVIVNVRELWQRDRDMRVSCSTSGVCLPTVAGVG